MQLVGRHVCFPLAERMERVDPVSTSFKLLPDHLITRHRPSFAILRFGADYSSRKDEFTTVFVTAKSLKGHRHLACKGASVPLLFFVHFYLKTTPNFGHNYKNKPLQFHWFQYGFVKNFAPCLCKNWSKTFFLLSE